MNHPSSGKGRMFARGQGCGPRRTCAALAPGDTLSRRRWVAQFRCRLTRSAAKAPMAAGQWRGAAAPACSSVMP